MDIYRIKHMSSKEEFKGTATVISSDAWDAVKAYTEKQPYEMGDKYRVTLPKDVRLDSGWKVSEKYFDEYGDDDDEHFEMWFSVGIYYTEKGGELVLLFSPGGITWVKLNDEDVSPLDLIVKWLKEV